jgi:hypothetical protein
MRADTVPIIGVSLGHRHEKMAISVVERTYVSTGEIFNAVYYDGPYGRARFELREKVLAEYRLRHLERQGPPSCYSKVAQRIPEIIHEIGEDIILVVDITATGHPAYSLILGELSAALKGTRTRFTQCPITVSGVAGGVSKSPDVGYFVPRRDLISATQIVFDEERFKIAAGLDLADTLKEELTSFKQKANKPSDDLEGWREGKHDDLVLAVAAGIWACERFLRKDKSRSAGDSIRSPKCATV